MTWFMKHVYDSPLARAPLLRFDFSDDFGSNLSFERLAMTEGRRLTAEELKQAGQALYGKRWKAPLATALGVKSNRIRQIIRGERHAASSWAPEVLELLRQRILTCHQALTRLQNSET